MGNQELGLRLGQLGLGQTAQAGWPTLWGPRPSTKKLGRQGLDQKVKRLQVSQAPCQTGLPGARIYYIITQSVSLWCHMRVGASVSSPGDHTLSASYRKSLDGNEKEGGRGERGREEGKKGGNSRTRRFSFGNILGAELI